MKGRWCTHWWAWSSMSQVRIHPNMGMVKHVTSQDTHNDGHGQACHKWGYTQIWAWSSMWQVKIHTLVGMIKHVTSEDTHWWAWASMSQVKIHTLMGMIKHVTIEDTHNVGQGQACHKWGYTQCWAGSSMSQVRIHIDGHGQACHKWGYTNRLGSYQWKKIIVHWTLTSPWTRMCCHPRVYSHCYCISVYGWVLLFTL